MKLRRDMHPNGGYFVSLPKEKVKLLDWCEGDVLSVDIVKDLFTIRKVSERQYPHPEPGERIEDLDRPGKVPEVPNRSAVSKAPAEVEIPTVEKTAQESPDKATNIMMTPAMKEDEMDPRSVEYAYRNIGISARHQGKCPACNGRITDSQRTCQICGANLVRQDLAANTSGPIGR